MTLKRLLLSILAACLVIVSASAAPPARNVIVITLDGFRWQEMFGGAQQEYFKRGSDGKPGAAETRFWRESAGDRRAVLMPFMWTTIAKEGQVFGDLSRSSRSHVTNGLWFSYPGYNEMFTGAADPRVDSNDKKPNPNITVLEWLNGRPGFKGRIAAFGSWDVLPFILNTERSGVPVGSGFTPAGQARTGAAQAINELATDLPAFWEYGPVDAPIVYAAIDALKTKKPRVLYIMLGEGDEWAHQGRYDLYLDATTRADRFIQRIWTLVQSMKEYRGNTTLLVTTDHGRGASTSDWNDHGRKIPAAEDTWMAALGAGVPALGVREGVTVTTSQLAATIAMLLGEDFRAAQTQAAAQLPLR